MQQVALRDCGVLPILLSKPVEIAWQQFLSRNRSIEIHAFSRTTYGHTMAAYESGTARIPCRYYTLDMVQTWCSLWRPLSLSHQIRYYETLIKHLVLFTHVMHLPAVECLLPSDDPSVSILTTLTLTLIITMYNKCNKIFFKKTKKQKIILLTFPL